MDLTELEHPAADVWYVFGPAEGWEDPPGTRVTVPQLGGDSHHAVLLAPIVGFDRLVRL